MKIYISADIEGVAGITNWEEADKTHASYQHFREEMTEEVVAACEGAFAAGATEVLIKDAHHTGRNIITARLPERARIVRAWSGHPLCMVQELDDSFAGVLFIGYHSKAGAEGNPLAHTLTGKVFRIAINGETASEFVIHSYAAALQKVPVLFISGDKGICQDAKTLNANIGTAAVSEGIGPSTVSLAPERARRLIREGVTAAVRGKRAACKIALPRKFVLEIEFNDPVSAYRGSWFPGVKHAGPRLLRFETNDFFEVLRTLEFVVLR
jgi:D-amino peptidase